MLGFRGPAQSSAALGDALNAGDLYLEVRRLYCETNQTVPVDIIRRRSRFTSSSVRCPSKLLLW